MRAFVVNHHRRALDEPSERRRWERFGEVLHCLQDSYSPAHAVRDGARLVRMKHWGLLDRRHAGADGPDEHGFPTDARDDAQVDGSLVAAAQEAARVSHAYLALALRRASEPEVESFLDDWVTGPIG